MTRRLRISLAFIMVLAFALCMGASPAFADVLSTNATTTFNTYLVVGSDSIIPDLAFSYEIAPGTHETAGEDTIEILAGPSGATISTADFTNASNKATQNGTPSDANASNKKFASAAVTVNLSAVNFPNPGVYRYVITESSSTAPGVVRDSSTHRYLDVFVTKNDTDQYVANYVLRSSESNISSTTNQYVTPDTNKSNGFVNEITTYDFTFSKSITGNQADTTKEFTFTLAIANANPGTYTVEGPSGSRTLIVGSDNEGGGTYTLTHNSTVTVKGLNAGAEWNVTENQEDYSPTYSINSAVAENGHVAQSGTGGLIQNTTVAFTNTKNGTIPTGVIVTVAPFAIGILLFGALVIFLLTKRRRDTLS